MTLQQAMAQAREASRNGSLQHVNRRDTDYIVSDWYGGIRRTVATFQHGERLDVEEINSHGTQS